MSCKSSGIAIALAWPETYCKQPGSWYDSLAEFIGISRYGYYKVGHAALLLIERDSGQCHYFDFGRYHSPFGKGRVRSQETDHELMITFKAVFDAEGKLSNYDKLLDVVANKKSCHGTGALHAGYLEINFEKAFSKATAMQKNSPLPYGPFIRNGSNCSRFVRTVIRSGAIRPIDRFKLISSILFSPTPKSNVRKLRQQRIVLPINPLNTFVPQKKDQSFYRCTLPSPDQHVFIPKNAQWLSGEGAGSWFVIEKESSLFRIQRFNENGDCECDCFGFVTVPGFNPELPFSILHPSDCSVVTIIQRDVLYSLKLFAVSFLPDLHEESGTAKTIPSYLSSEVHLIP